MLFFDHINLHLYLTYIVLYLCIHLYHIYLICTIIIHIKNWFGHFAWSQVKNRQPQFLRSHWTKLFFLRSWIFMMIMGCQIKTSDFYKSSQSNWYWLNFRCNELLVRIQRILFPLQKAAWHSTMQDVLFGPHDAEIRKMSGESWWMFHPHCDWRFRGSKWFQMARHLGKHVKIEHPRLFNALNVAKWLGTGECSTQQRCRQCFWDRKALIQLSCCTQGCWVINPE